MIRPCRPRRPELPSSSPLPRQPAPDSPDGEYNYCPRDVLLPIGTTIIETPMTNRTRYFGTFAYRDLLREYFDSGANWISAPKPIGDRFGARGLRAVLGIGEVEAGAGVPLAALVAIGRKTP